MCGIAGIFIREARTPDAATAWRMIDSVAHRGPDRRAVHVEPHIALSSARLSIVDLSPAADQPLSDSSGDLMIIFNGEIYNFKEVRADLESRGHHFRSHSDTEVVLCAFREWGVECHRRFNGMWAFAIWDRKERRLLLSRDRFGVKPLYIAHVDGQILFASEIKSLLAAGVPAALGSGAFNQYCGGESMFEGIAPLPPGSYSEYRIDSSEPLRRTWWNTAENLVTPPKRYDDRVEAFRELLFDAVRLRLRTDVAPAVTLSGGLDSSSIYASCQILSRSGRAVSATEERPVTARACVVTFPGSSIDESTFASRVAQHFGQNIRRFEVAPDDFRQLVERATWHQEGLVWNSSVIVYHEFYRQLAESGVRVVLEGHGTDELLAGYGNFAQDAMQQRLRSLRLLSAWSAARALSRLRNPVLGHSERSPIVKLAPGAVRSFLPRKKPPQAFAADIPALSPLKRALYGGFHSRLLPTVLRVNDRATMAAGIESRAPFLDYRLVTFIFSLPDDDIIGNGWTKRILRDSMASLLPRDIAWREKKVGFLAPQPEWFNRRPVIAALEEAITDGTIARAPGVDRRKYIETLTRGKLAGFRWQDSTELWTAYSFAIWHDVFLSRSRPAASTTAAAAV